MKYSKWLEKNTSSLCSKTVAITGSTGGLGQELCRYCAHLGADLLLLDRDPKRSSANRQRILGEFPSVNVDLITCDLEDMDSVRAATDELERRRPDAIIHNAGAYSIPRCICTTGYDNIFQINFVSPYYMTRRLLPILKENGGRVVAVGSIAHNYSKTDMNDIDFHTRSKASLAYGNAKRHLMFSLYELFDKNNASGLAVTHPGITFTNITAHYPRLIFAIIKHPMKIIFMRKDKAALSILRGLFEDCPRLEWIGPRVFNVWGLPRRQKLSTCSNEESLKIYTAAEQIYSRL